MKDYTQVERDNAALTIREYAFGQMNMLRMLDDDDAANNLQEAINVAIAALRGPQPDPDTGLAPCGCGGKAGFHYSVMQRDNDCCVACGTCGVHSRVALCEEEARDAWNRAMGWRESE